MQNLTNEYEKQIRVNQQLCNEIEDASARDGKNYYIYKIKFYLFVKEYILGKIYELTRGIFSLILLSYFYFLLQVQQCQNLS